MIAEKTDDHAHLPEIKDKSDKYHFYTDFNFEKYSLAPAIVFTISDDADAPEIPHDPDIVGKPRDYIGDLVVPEGERKDDKVADTEIQNDPISDTSTWNDAPVDNGTDFDFIPASTSDVQNTIKQEESATNSTINNSKPTIKSKKTVNTNDLIFIRDTNIYNQKGQIVKKAGAYRIKQFGKKVKILDHGKIYTFKNLKNKKFYRIGKNRYVDVKSVGRASKAQKINTRGTINASHKYGIKLYNAKGKFTKKIFNQ